MITVEGELTKALRLLFRNPALECVGASRTDAGVHALGQRAVIDVETSIPAEKIPLAIRSFLPADIVVTKAEEVAETFHPRFDCVEKNVRISFLECACEESEGTALFRLCAEAVGCGTDERGGKGISRNA